jgi:hypothetical protein
MKKLFIAAFAVALGGAVAIVASAARNSSGTYSLPSGNPVVSGTTISSTWANNTLSDIRTEITDSLSRSNKGGMLAALSLANGTVAAPGLTWSSDSDCGLYRIGSNNIGWAVNGAKVVDVGTAGVGITGTLSATGAATLSSTAAVTGLITGSAGASLTQSASNTAGLVVTGNGTAAGITATGGATGIGVVGTGGGTSGYGGQFTGVGAFDGVRGVSGATDNTSGVSGSVGAGATNGFGVAGTGKGAGQGGRFTGGTTGAGVWAAAGTATTSGQETTAVEITNGAIYMGGVTAVSTGTGVTNMLLPNNIPKAFGKITCSGNPFTCAVDRGFNIVGATRAASDTVTVEIADNMASAEYALILNQYDFYGVWPLTSRAAGTFDLWFANSAGVNQSIDTTLSGLTFEFVIFGLQ